eukprot:SAG31_NODE_61_length_29286_cov_444.645973_14_plen_65_part_00
MSKVCQSRLGLPLCTVGCAYGVVVSVSQLLGLCLLGKSFADSIGIDFYETSAKDSLNVDQVLAS